MRNSRDSGLLWLLHPMNLLESCLISPFPLRVAFWFASLRAFLTLVCVLVMQSCPTLCDPMDCSPLSSSVHGILQARVLEWIAIPFSRWSSLPRDRTQVSCVSSTADWFLTSEPLRELLCGRTLSLTLELCFYQLWEPPGFLLPISCIDFYYCHFQVSLTFWSPLWVRFIILKSFLELM